jgi:exonuclease SbcC
MFVPLRLEFSGILSYLGSEAEPTTIDFEALTEEGMFGIFGPTGAGKTAILDAICIALFDETYRVDSKTDFIHPQAATAHVALSYRSNGHLWQVVRKWRRTRKTKTGKGGELAEGELVLYQNGTALTTSSRKKELQALIGESLNHLSLDQFKIAVVIPQNQFAELLRKTGAEFTKLMENLLQLGRYDYAEATAQLKRNTETQLNVCLALQNAVAYATSEAVDEKKAQLVALNTELAAARKELEAATALHNALEASRALADDLLAAQQKLELLEAEAPQMANLEAALLREQAALALEPFANQLQTLLGEEVSATNALDGANERLAQATQAQANATTQHTEAESLLAEWLQQNEPRTKLLEQYREPARQLAADALALSNASSQSRNAESARNQAQRTLESLRTQAEALRHERDKLKLEAAANQAEREAQAALAALAPLASALARLVEERNRLREEYKLANAECNQALANCNELQARLSVLATPAAHTWADVVQELEGQLEACRQKETLLRAQLHVSEQAQALLPGQPCPLCGSSHHPNPALPSQAIRLQLDNLGQEVADLKRKQAEAHNGLSQHGAFEAALASAQAKREELLERGRRLASQIEADQAGLGGNAPQAIQAAAAAQEAATAKGQQLATQLEDVEQRLKKLEAEMEQARQSLSKAEAQLAASQAEERTLTERVQLTRDALVLAGIDPSTDFDREGETLAHQRKQLANSKETAQAQLTQANTALALAKQAAETAATALAKATERAGAARADLDTRCASSLFATAQGLLAYLAQPNRLQPANAQRTLQGHREALAAARAKVAELAAKAQQSPFDPQAFETATHERNLKQQQVDTLHQSLGETQSTLERMQQDHQKWHNEEAKRVGLQKRHDLLADLANLFRGNSFKQFLLTARMEAICTRANHYLARFGLSRYELLPEFSTGNKFELRVRDLLNANEQRRVETLSGGETFMVALALALGLSALVQRGQPGFFFLDEGFGNLSQDLLEQVLDTLSQLVRSSSPKLSIGLISHIDTVQEYLSTYPHLVVTPASAQAKGSRIEMR